MEELEKVKTCFDSINKEISLFSYKNNKIIIGENFIFKIMMWVILLIGILIIFFKENYFIYFSLFLIPFIIIIVSIFRKFLFNKYSYKEMKHYKKWWLDFKYQKLRDCIIEKNIDKEKISHIISLLEEEQELVKKSFIDKNPMFVISFAVFIAVMSSGSLDRKIVNIVFILSIIGMFISFYVQPLLFSNEEQLIYLLKHLINDTNKQIKDEK